MSVNIVTKKLYIDSDKLKASQPEYMIQLMAMYEEIGNRLKDGDLVAFPTETVYGLGANIFIPSAVKAVYEAKGRPSDNPMIVHIADFSELETVSDDVTECGMKLVEKFWPGPLTVVLKRSDAVSRTVTGGLDTVAVRMPSHPVARSIIRFADVPVAAPSANSSGKPSPTKCEHVIEDLDKKIQIIVCCDSAEIGVESTVVDCTGDVPVILRPGAITSEMIKSVCGDVIFSCKFGDMYSEDIPKSPGIKYAHYAPNAPAVMITGDNDGVVYEISKRIAKNDSAGKKTGVLTFDNFVNTFKGDNLSVLSLGNAGNPGDIAANLYDKLRSFNFTSVDEIIIHGIEQFENDERYEAVYDRLTKAVVKTERI